MRRTHLIVGIAISLATLLWVQPGSAGETNSVTGTYKEALSKAGDAGKLLMIDFYTDWCGWCKVMDKEVHQIPDTMKKFAYYRVNAEREKDLARQFQVRGYPTVVFVKPDGTEFHRWSGAFKTTEELKQQLESVLQKPGAIQPKPTETAEKTDSTSTDPKPSAVSGGESELKTAQIYLKVGRVNDATKLFRQIVSKYPNTEAAATAQQKLDELSSGAGK